MIHQLHTLACALRRLRDRAEHELRWRPVRRAGFDPVPSLAGGRYYIAVGTRGLRCEHEYELSRDDMEQLGEAITALLAITWPDGRGGWQWFDRTEHEDALAHWQRNLLEQQARTEGDQPAADRPPHLAEHGVAYLTDTGRYVIADQGGWLPGTYETEDAARLAVTLDHEQLVALGDATPAGRGITVADLRTVLDRKTTERAHDLSHVPPK